MLKTRLPSFALAGIMLGALAACDTGADDGAQVAADEAPTSEALTFGEPFYDFAGSAMAEATLTAPNGETLALNETVSDGGGKPVLLNLWATWCAPCIEEMPQLNTIANEMSDDVTVLTVNVGMDSAAKVDAFFSENGLTDLPRWLDSENAVAEHFGGGVQLPLTVMYDGQGREIWRMLGAYDWASEEARALILESFPESAQ